MKDATLHLATRIGAVALGSVLSSCGPIDLGSYGFVVHEDAGSHDAGAEPECRVAADCDDADPCNGVFACREGECRLVTQACTNPDEAHCEARCDVTDGRCVVSALDRDGDGHGDLSCPYD